MTPKSLGEMLAVSDSMGLGSSCIRILCHLIEHRESTVIITDLCRITNLSKAAMTATIDRLENSQLVTRSSHREDRRKIIISISSKGAKAIDRIIRRKALLQPQKTP